jgi:SAM-dependent methyltransferase
LSQTYDVSAFYYDLLAALQGDDALPSVSFFAGFARPGGSVLDVGAGTGRIALAMAAIGANVYCLEPSHSMRTALMSKLAERSDLWPRVTVLDARAPEFNLGRKFDYAFLAGVMQFIRTDERPLLFETLARHLHRGGTLALDMVGEDERDWSDVLVGELLIGDCRYQVYCSGEAIGPERTSVRFRYRTSFLDSVIAEQVETREREMHRRADVAADLEAAGFAIIGAAGHQAGPTGQSDQDGGTMVAELRG